MNTPEQPKNWVEQYDVFISYARKDNAGEPPMVSAFVKRLEDDFAQFSPAVRLVPFFDKQSILDGQYWQDVIRKGLRQSKVMIAFLSEAYFHSEWCRKEWEEYILVEQGRTYPGEALTPIFIVAPPDLEQRIPESAKDWWQDMTGRNAVVEFVPYWPSGEQALREAVVERRLRTLEENIQRRVELGRVLAAVPRNPLLGERNPNFVGRRAELTDLRQKLERHEMVGLCAVNGVGGIGKSSLAREYAYFFRPEYLGAQFLIDLSTATTFADIQRALVSLARDYLRADIPHTLDEAEQYDRAVGAFHELDANHKALVILDNLNETAVELVGVNSRKHLPSAEKVHYLITTRAEPRDLGGIGTVSLDVLPPHEALEVLFRYRAFARRVDDPDYMAAQAGRYQLQEGEDWSGDAEWKAALAIVNRLGRHSLAVALVGAYLGSYPDLSYARFAEELAFHGIGLALDVAGNDARVRALIEHPVPLIGELFERSVDRLSPLALRTLEYAAVLPPDLVPIAWLRELVSSDPEMTQELQAKPFGADPWDDTLRTLDGLDYLKGFPYGRMHRVVQEVVLRRMTEQSREERRQRVEFWIENRAVSVNDGLAEYTDLSEIDAVLVFTRLESKRNSHLVARTAIAIVPTHMNLGRLGVAVELAQMAERVLRGALSDDHRSAEMERDLGFALDQLGVVSVASGDLKGARDYFTETLFIRMKLVHEDTPGSTKKKRELAFTFDSLGDVSVAEGELEAAWRCFAGGLEIRMELATINPHSAETKRELSYSLEKLGRMSLAKKDLDGARDFFEKVQTLRLEVVAEDPKSAEKWRELTCSYDNIGELIFAKGDLKAARFCFEEGMKIRRKLVQDDPLSADMKRDLSVSLNKLGEVSEASGDLKGASSYFEECLTIRRQLALADPSSAQKQRDLSISIIKLGDVSVARGDLQGAQSYFEESLRISRQLAQDDPHSAQKKRDLMVSHYKLGGVFRAEGDFAAARASFQAGIDVLDQMIAAGQYAEQSQREKEFLIQELAKCDPQ